MGRNKTYLIKWLVFLGDVLLLNILFLFLYQLLRDSLDPFLLVRKKEVLLLINLCYLLSFSLFTLKISERTAFVEEVIKQASKLVVTHLLLLSVCFFLFSIDIDHYSFFIYFYLSFYLLFILWRVGARITLKAYRKSGRNFQRIVIVGAGKNGLELYEMMRSQTYFGFKVVAVFDDNEDLATSIPEYKGKVVETSAFCLEQAVDAIYCTLPSSEDDKISGLLTFAEKNMIRFFIVPEFYRYLKRQITVNAINHLPVIAIRDEPLQHWHHRFFKRCFDLVFSSLVLVFLFIPIYLVLGLLIKLSSPGPVIFKQKRTGLYGRDFYCYKFRSMRANKESDTKQAQAHDPRITKIGQFMRKTNLDEFPQFFNVLIGDMSVVGPRPHMLKHTQQYSELIDKYMVRHLVKPGITGWAQVTGFRGETKTVEQMAERVKRDVWYIENVSLLLDLKIIFYTVFRMVSGDKKAY